MNKDSILKSFMVQVTGIIAMVVALLQSTPEIYLTTFGTGLIIQFVMFIEMLLISKDKAKEAALIAYYITMIAGMILLPVWIEMFKATPRHTSFIFLAIPATNLTLLLIFVLSREEE
jgi:hypothetical protein